MDINDIRSEADALFEQMLTYAEEGNLEKVLNALIELESRKTVTLYAGTCSFDEAKKCIADLSQAGFYFYRRKNKKGYYLYVNPLGIGIKEDGDLFDREKKRRYSKRALCGSGADTRSGEYFKHRARGFFGELFSELFAELIVCGIFLALGIGVMHLLDVSFDNLDPDTVILLGICAFVVVVTLISITVSAFKRKGRSDNITMNDNFDESATSSLDTSENAIWTGDVAEKSEKSFVFHSAKSRTELLEQISKRADEHQMKRLITEDGFRLMVKTTHGGKYIYDARVTERDDGCEVSGELWFISWGNGKKNTVMSKIGNAVLYVLTAIMLVILAIPLGIYYLIRKLFKLKDDDSDLPKNVLIAFMTDEIGANYVNEIDKN